VQFPPLPSDTIGATFTNSTGFIGTRRRRAKRKQPLAQPLTNAKTIHPRKLPPPLSPAPQRAQPTHHHGTHANQPLHHVAATARALLLADAARTPTPLAHPTTPVHYALHGNAFNPDTGKLAEYWELSQCSEGSLWQESNCEEIGRLAQGYGAIKGTNTMFFIAASAIPKGRKATYLQVISALRPEKVNPRRVRWTAGGDKIDYPFDVSTKTADLTTANKLLFNSVLSTPNAKLLAANLKDFYLGTPMEKNLERIIQVNLLWERLQDLTRYPTSVPSQ
jgi:hypothetical protein